MDYKFWYNSNRTSRTYVYETDPLSRNVDQQKSVRNGERQITIARVTLLERAVAKENVAENGADVYCFLWRWYICWLFLEMCTWRWDSRGC